MEKSKSEGNVTRLAWPVERKLESELRASLDLLEALRHHRDEVTTEQHLRAAEFVKGYEFGLAISRRRYFEAIRLCGLDVSIASQVQRAFLELCAKDDSEPVPPTPTPAA